MATICLMWIRKSRRNPRFSPGQWDKYAVADRAIIGRQYCQSDPSVDFSPPIPCLVWQSRSVADAFHACCQQANFRHHQALFQYGLFSLRAFQLCGQCRSFLFGFPALLFNLLRFCAGGRQALEGLAECGSQAGIVLTQLGDGCVLGGQGLIELPLLHLLFMALLLWGGGCQSISRVGVVPPHARGRRCQQISACRATERMTDSLAATVIRRLSMLQWND